MSKNYDWILEQSAKLINLCNKHNKGCLIVPFAHDLDEAEKNHKNGDPTFMLTDLTDESSFMGAITMALTAYCKQKNIKCSEALDNIKLAIEKLGVEKKDTKKESFMNTDEGKGITIDADMVMHPNRYKKGTRTEKCWNSFDEWERKTLKTIENYCRNNDSDYTLLLRRGEKDTEGHDIGRFLVSGNMSTIDVLGAIASLLCTVCNDEELTVEDAITFIGQFVKDNKDKLGDDYED